MSEAEELVGATIAGKYRLRRLIGVGGMGCVYEGLHVDLAKKVAVKIIDSGTDTSPELATRFRREARAASAVESEGIVQVFDVGRDPEVGLYMVMELLHGEDVEARLRKQPGRRLDPVLVAQIGHQAARALVKAHAARVIHRDLKPANIFLTDRDDGSLRVKILDFGISKLLASEASIATNKEGLLELTAAGVALGTPQYMSPEQAQGLTTVDHRADVWGLGVVLYEALAGIPAFPELRTYQETIINLLQQRAQPLSVVAPWVPEALAKVVHESIEHDVSKRIQSCALLAARIEEAVPELVTASTGPFNAAQQLAARLGSSPSHAAYSLAKGNGAAAAMPASVRRPISLGDDTQVVLRTSDPGSMIDDNDPSTTMLADSVRSARGGRGTPKVQILGPTEDEAPLSIGDPTMFQAPAWMEAAKDAASATLKTGLSVTESPTVPTVPTLARSIQGMSAGLLTAFLIVVIGGSALLLVTRGDSSADTAAPSPPVGTTTAAPPVPPEPAPEPAPPAVTPFIPAPPATGTSAIPQALPLGVLGAAPLAEPSGAVTATDAGATTATADSAR